jgi:hypothetical protein
MWLTAPSAKPTTLWDGSRSGGDVVDSSDDEVTATTAPVPPKIVSSKEKSGKTPKQQNGTYAPADRGPTPCSGGGAANSSGGGAAAADDFESADMGGEQHYPPGTPLDQYNLHRLKAYHHDIGATTPGADLRLRDTWLESIYQHRKEVFEKTGKYAGHDKPWPMASLCVVADDGSEQAMHVHQRKDTEVPAVLLEGGHEPQPVTVTMAAELADPELALTVAVDEGVYNEVASALAAGRSPPSATTDKAYIHRVLARSLENAKKLGTWEDYIKPAHEREMRKIAENHVLGPPIPITDVKDRKQLVTSFINYTAVLGPDLSLDKVKARFLARGFSQEKGHSYFDTASATPFMTSIRVVLCLTGWMDWEVLKHDDVDVAYLTGVLKEVIYLRMPPDMREYNDQGVELVRRILRGQYGLKQSGRTFGDLLATTMEGLGFERSKYDSCVYFIIRNKDGSERKRTDRDSRDRDEMEDDRRPSVPIFGAFDPKTQDILIVIAFVDDLLSAGTSIELYTEYRKGLLKTFKLSGGEDAEWYLSMKIVRDRRARTITVSQQGLVESLGERFPWLHDSRPVKTPLPEGTKFLKEDQPSPAEADRRMQESYRTALGVLLYCCKTRMDLSQATAMLSRAMSNPGAKHQKMMEHLMRYAWHTRNRSLVLGGHKMAPNARMSMFAYCDSDWAGSEKLKSTTGFIIELNGCLIAFKSKLQSTCARSSCHAELIAASLASAEIVHLRNFISELGFPPDGPTIVGEDNQATIATAGSPVTSQRLRHLQIADMYVRECTSRGKLWLTYVESAINPSDVLTKPLGRILFYRHISQYYNDDNVAKQLGGDHRGAR